METKKQITMETRWVYFDSDGFALELGFVPGTPRRGSTLEIMDLPSDYQFVQGKVKEQIEAEVKRFLKLNT